MIFNISKLIDELLNVSKFIITVWILKRNPLDFIYICEYAISFLLDTVQNAIPPVFDLCTSHLRIPD